MVAVKPISPTSAPWRGAFEDLPREHGFEPLEVEGVVPAELEGTLFRNGPSRFGNADGRYGHWFDGDGAVSAVRLANGAAEGAVRFVKSWHLDRERTSGRTRSMGFATRAGGPFAQIWAQFKKQARNPGNTSVMVWKDRLLALYEGAGPTELSIDDLETIGVTDLDGALTTAFSAHPHVTADGTIYNFGVEYGRVAKIALYRLGENAERVREVPVRGQPMLHDFITTERHAVFMVSPIWLSPFPVLLGLKTPLEAFSWQANEGTDVHVVPFDPSEPVRSFTVDAFYQWHFAQAFERGDEIVVDLVEYPDFTTNDFLSSLFERKTPAEPANGKLVRRTFDPSSGRMDREVLFSGSCEFPTVARGESTHVYVATHRESALDPFDSIVRTNVETGETEAYDLGTGGFVSEPLPVGDHLLMHVYDGHRNQTNLTILDRHHPDRGPVARCWFDHHLPPTFHGVWHG